MFKQLSPLLSTRSLVITATLVDNDRIRVTVNPRPTGKDEAKELSQPFAVEGTAEELDNELPAAIAGYTTEHMSLARSLEVIKTNMDAALKAAKAEADKKVAEARKTTGKPGAVAKAPEPAPAPPAKPAEPSLFDPPADEPTAPKAAPQLATMTPSTQVPGSTTTTATINEEDEILQEAFFGAEDDRIAA